MILRQRMPTKRRGVTEKVMLGPWKLYITVNFYPNGQPGEVFAKVGKSGSTISGLVDSACVLMSMLLQVGVPASRVTEKMRGTRFEPSDDNHSSLVDAIACTIVEATERFGGRSDLDYLGNKVHWHPQPMSVLKETPDDDGDTEEEEGSPEPEEG